MAAVQTSGADALIELVGRYAKQGRMICLALLVSSLATPAFAYVGPGAGLTLIGSLLAVVAAAALAIIGLVMFPIRLAMKKARQAKLAREAEQSVLESDPL
jgi:hypothetical protein